MPMSGGTADLHWAIMAEPGQTQKRPGRIYERFFERDFSGCGWTRMAPISRILYTKE
jgi:hypothetical protein